MVRDFIIMMVVVITILLWHPWSGVDEEVKESIFSQLMLEKLVLEENWEPLGLKVDVFGIEYNQTNLTRIGYFNVNYWGKVDVIHTINYGNLSPNNFNSIIVIENNTKPDINSTIPDALKVSVGESFELNFSITPNQEVKAWEMGLRYNSSLLRANHIVWGDYFGNLSVFRSPNYVIDNIEGVISKLYELTIEKNKVTKLPGTLVRVNFTALNNGTAIVFAETFGVTNGINYISVKLDEPIQTRVII